MSIQNLSLLLRVVLGCSWVSVRAEWFVLFSCSVCRRTALLPKTSSEESSVFWKPPARLVRVYTWNINSTHLTGSSAAPHILLSAVYSQMEQASQPEGPGSQPRAKSGPDSRWIDISHLITYHILSKRMLHDTWAGYGEWPFVTVHLFQFKPKQKRIYFSKPTSHLYSQNYRQLWR